MRHHLIALTLLGSSQLALAEADPFFSMGVFFTPYNELKLDVSGLGSSSPDGTGYGLRAEVGGALHLHGEYVAGQLDVNSVDVDVTDSRLGLGYRSHFDGGYILAIGEYVGINLEIGSADATDEGIGVHLGGGYYLNDRTTLYGRLGVIALDDLDGSEVRVGINSKLNESTIVFAQYRTMMLSESGFDMDVNDLRIGVNFSF